MRLFLALLCYVLSARVVSAQVVINEVFPAPSDGSEWVELYNSADTEIDLTNWILTDQLSSPTKLSDLTGLIVEANNFLVIELSSAKLNNAADGVTLTDSDNNIIDEMSYQDSETDLSWSRDENGEYHLSEPTKAQVNLIPSPTPSSSPSPSPTPSSSPLSSSTAENQNSVSSGTQLSRSSLQSIPSPPILNHPFPKLTLQSTSMASSAASLLHLRTQELPKIPLLSVILGGSCLFFIGGWKIHEQIKSNSNHP